MPEGPEVEIVRRGLELLTGRKIEDVFVANHKKYDQEVIHSLIGTTITSIERRGKMMIFSFSDGRYATHHLGMTGIWRIYSSDSEVQRAKHLKIIFFTDTNQFHFIDVRTFGYFRIVESIEVVNSIPYVKNLGPDILDENFNTELFSQRIRGVGRKRSKEIGRILLESNVVSGCGNIYKSESLFRAGIHPSRGANTLSDEEISKLATELCAVGREALKSGGSTLRDFANVDGYDGLMQNKFKVYGRAGKPCSKCGSEVESFKQGGRRTFFCPECQK